MISLARDIGVRTPFIYLVDHINAEIIMEFIDGFNARDFLNKSICFEIGKYASILHSNCIIHGDLTPSNFLVEKNLVAIDFGLSYHSTRVEDKAVDIRLLGEILCSLYPGKYHEFYQSFIDGYRSISDAQEMTKILRNVEKINSRRRYAEKEK